ncbi:beta-2-microglobulin-like [Notolabrus celidotus]|uniref:beta-2-microglobulin-like n=1 Tax=Notolabrus celidotus TaxID=1203425 RepID=UPI00148FEC6A|nr:beta-2-microglobulin-like [Notolabrus celidotus]
MMKLPVFGFLFALIAACSCVEKLTPPKVQLYSQKPGEFGKENFLICHVSGFYPPNLSITILKDGQELPNSRQTDLSFSHDWSFHLTKNVAFTPMSGEDYACKVMHNGKSKSYAWESNM